MIIVTTGARVHSRHEHEAGRIIHREASPRYRNHPLLEGLTHDFKYITTELWEFVKEQHPIVR